ncbi:MAG: metal-sulfur cluster assembly factor [Opitutaceae bacterium]|nr:metal-sulfur cluster assembly factor [Opitutaceae bacterium]
MNAIPDTATVWAALSSIPDPEFGVNIVDLGLIYSVECNNGDIAVTMTLTTPSCPSGGWIHEGAKQALERLPGAKTVSVAMVFEPPWTTAMLSEAAQRQLGHIG